jgi:prevent-host-death family protein
MVATTITAAEFKAKCLELMDRVHRTGNQITITKRGKPVARLVPAQQRPKSLFGALKGHIQIKGDIVGEISGSDEWEAMR